VSGELYLGFVAASALLMLIPGPNVALIAANSIGLGARYGLLTIAGTSAAMVVQLGLTVLGMATLLALLADGFAWLRWLGVAYLVYLGVRRWRAAADDLARVQAQTPSVHAVFWRGFAVSATNPKTLLFYAAFFPQFVEPGAGMAARLIALAVTFLMLAVVIDSGWALAAGRLRPLLAGRHRLRNRLSGGLLVGAGLGLALARRT
jgi:threonine/homoserine/homoserine lactone efflux protein